MNFQVASDIHIEKLYPKLCDIEDFIIPVEGIENLILAGDIGSIYQIDCFKHFFLSCKRIFKNVLYVPGNNEYYLREGFEMKTKKDLDNDLEKLCQEIGILLLNNAYIELENIIIFGSTWWSHVPDILNIRINIDKNRKMNSDDFNHFHTQSRRSLNWILEQNITKQKKVLVISHYCPTKIGTMNGHHRREDFIDLIPYYFSASEKFLKKDLVDTWIFGHTHVFRDFYFDQNQTRIISNADPRKKFFRRNFVLEFPSFRNSLTLENEDE